jgi:hypothetical protein
MQQYETEFKQNIEKFKKRQMVHFTSGFAKSLLTHPSIFASAVKKAI